MTAEKPSYKKRRRLYFELTIFFMEDIFDELKDGISGSCVGLNLGDEGVLLEATYKILLIRFNS